MLGRRKIYTSAVEITRANILDEVNLALSTHLLNVSDEEYLYWYRRGRQPILERTKEIRPEINNKVVVNNAQQIVTFKNGYFLTKPASYVSRKEDNSIVEEVRGLNEFLYRSGKAQADNKIVNWFHTVGIGVLYVAPNEGKDVPFKCYALDPRCAFNVYSLAPGNERVMGINVVGVGDRYYFDVFTQDKVFKLLGGTREKSTQPNKPSMCAMSILEESKNQIGEIPIIEYIYNDTRMSAFEPALDLMDAINNVESNRIDGIEQFVQSLIVTTNVQLEEGVTANDIRQAGMINLKSVGENKADFKVLAEQLDQSQTQVTLDDLYEQMLYKCSMPSTVKGGTSTSDTGTAVYLRDGFAMADTDARNTTDEFIEANRYFDKVMLSILTKKHLCSLNEGDFELKIERNSTSNLVTKTQVAMNMKQLGFAPEICFGRSGISSDPLTDVELSKKYIDLMWTTKEEVQVQENEPDEI